jgi:hypothetical protein
VPSHVDRWLQWHRCSRIRPGVQWAEIATRSISS